MVTHQVVVLVPGNSGDPRRPGHFSHLCWTNKKFSTICDAIVSPTFPSTQFLAVSIDWDLARSGHTPSGFGDVWREWWPNETWYMLLHLSWTYRKCFKHLRCCDKSHMALHLHTPFPVVTIGWDLAFICCDLASDCGCVESKVVAQGDRRPGTCCLI